MLRLPWGAVGADVAAVTVALATMAVGVGVLVFDGPGVKATSVIESLEARTTPTSAARPEKTGVIRNRPYYSPINGCHYNILIQKYK